MWALVAKIARKTPEMSDTPAEVARHYGRGGLLGRIMTALTEAGKDVNRLNIQDLAPFDEFHSRQRRAT